AEGSGIEPLDRLGIIGGFRQYGERKIRHVPGGIAFDDGAVHHRGNGSVQPRQVAMTGRFSSASAIRRRVPVVVSGGRAPTSKKPQAMISRFGSGIRSWRNALTTKTAT